MTVRYLLFIQNISLLLIGSNPAAYSPVSNSSWPLNKVQKTYSNRVSLDQVQ